MDWMNSIDSLFWWSGAVVWLTAALVVAWLVGEFLWAGFVAAHWLWFACRCSMGS